jgi:uncharacterized protein
VSRRPSPMRRKVRQWSILATGWIFVLLGVVGLFLPLMQGVLFILIGLVLLSAVSPRARLAIQRIRRRWPRTGARIDATRRRANRVLTRMFGG